MSIKKLNLFTLVIILILSLSLLTLLACDNDKTNKTEKDTPAEGNEKNTIDKDKDTKEVVDKDKDKDTKEVVDKDKDKDTKEVVDKDKDKTGFPGADFSVTQREYTKALENGEKEINVFCTNDEHGWIFDWDFGNNSPRQYRGESVPSGLARVSTLYKKLSSENPNSLIVSAGDSIQGTILTYYYNYLDTNIKNPVSVIFDKIGYEAWAVGNHEIEQGGDVLSKVVKEFEENGIAVLSSNAVLDKDMETPYFQPYYVKEIDGVRVGFLGMTTPGIPMWLDESTHEGYEFLDMVETAKRYVPILREQEKVDVLIGLFHAGMNEQYDIKKAEARGVPAPNASRLVAEATGSGSTGFDAIITAHSHALIDDNTNTDFKDSTNNIVNGVKFIQAKNWGSHLGQLKIKLKAQDDRWVIDTVSAITHSMEGVEEDPEILEAMRVYIEGAKKYAEKGVGDITETLKGDVAYFRDSGIVDLIHETQLHFTEADISIAANFSSTLVIPEGEITVGEIAGIYIYENFLNAIELTGHQIKDYLEYSSNYYNVINAENVETEPLVNPDVRGYNYDMAQGFKYEIDLTKEPGERIVNMRNMDDSPFDMDKTYTVALNSYRYNGGGGHLEACGAMKEGIHTVETTYFSDKAMRDLMIEYFKVKNTWGPEDVDHNWELIPDEIAEVAIEDQLENMSMGH